jgi:hypothetical protein
VLVRLDLLCESLAVGEDLLRGFGVLPEAGLDYLFLEGFELAASCRGVKENSAVR